MAKITVAAIRKQIASLEAKATQLAEDEIKGSVAKVRALMDSLGVTIEHLAASISKRGTKAKKAVPTKKVGAKRAGAGQPKYRDPETGATWTGFGRAPGWIAAATDRAAFLISAASTDAGPAARKSKKAPAASKKAGRAGTEAKAKSVASSTAAKTPKKATNKAPAKKVGSRKVAAERTAETAVAAAGEAPTGS